MNYEEDFEKVAEVIRLHDEAFERYQKCPGAMWKSSEGAVSIHFGNVWDRENRPSVEVYSYALGPNRNHYFKDADEALTEVRGWHRDAFTHTCGEDC